MGQRLVTFGYNSPEDDDDGDGKLKTFKSKFAPQYESFPDLKFLPPEIGLKILSNVEARDLRLCKEFWKDLADDDFLWKRQV